MAGVRGRGFSTGKALQILFRIVADGSQARREVNKTAKEASGEIRAVETLLQRALSVLSRPIRSRLGLTGALGISLAREQLRGLAANEIQKVKKAYGEVGDEAEKTTKKVAKASTGASAAITGVSAALLAIRSAPAAAQIQEVSKDFAEATFAIQTFEKVLLRTTQAAPTGKTFGPQVAFGQDLKALLGNLGVKPSRATEGDLLGKFGMSFRDKDAQEALAEFAKEFNNIPVAIDRAALAARIFGADTARMIPILEKVRTQTLNQTKALQDFEAVSKNLAALSKAEREFAGLSITASRKREEAAVAERVAKAAALKAEAAPRFQALRTFAQIPRKDLPPFTKAEATIGSTLKIWNEYVKANIRVREEQKLATDALFGFIEKVKAAKTATTEAKVILESYAGSMGKIDVAETELHFAEQRVKNTKELIARNQELVREFEKRKVTGLPDDQAQQAINRLTTKIAFQQEALVGYNKELTKANQTLETFKDEMFLARKEAEALEHEQQLLEGSLLATRERLKQATIAVEEDPLEKTKRMRMENVAAAEKGSDEAAAKATELRTIADEAHTKALTKKAEVAERAKQATSGLGFQEKLAAKETELLSKALKDVNVKDSASLLNVLKQLNTFKTGAGGPKKGISLPELDSKSFGSIESFIKGFAELATAEERAAFATSILGEELAAKLIPALEATLVAEVETTAATVTLEAALGGIVIVITAAAVATAVLGAALFLIAKKMAESDALMARLAERTGISTEHISALDIAAKKAGLGGIKTVQERLGSFDRILGQVARGELPETAFLLRKLGIDAQKTGITTDEAFVKIVDAYNSTTDPGEKAVLMQKLFADRTGKMGLTVQEIGPKMEEFTKQIKEQGLALTEGGGKAALSFDRSVSILSERISAMGVQFARPLVRPLAEGLTALTTDLGDTISLASILGELVSQKIREVTDSLVGFTGFLKVFTDNGFFKTMTMDVTEFTRQWGKNVIAIQKGNTQLKTTEEERQTQLEETLRREEQASKNRIAQIELERDTYNKAQDSMTAHYKQQLERRAISRDEARKGEKKALTDSLASDVAANAEAIQVALRKRTSTPEEADTKATEIAKLSTKALELQAEFGVKMGEIETERIVHEREQMEQMHDEEIAAARALADEKIDILEAASEKDINVRKENLEAITRLNNEIFSLEIQELERRRKLAGADGDLRRQLTAQINLKYAEQHRAGLRALRDIDEADFNIKISRIKLQASVLQNLEQVNQARIAAMREAAERRRPVAVGDRAAAQAAAKDVQDAVKEAGIFRDLAIQTGFAVGVTNNFVQDYGNALVELTKKVRIYNQVKLQEDTVPITLSQVTAETRAILLKFNKDRANLKQKEIDEGKKHNNNVEALEIEKQGIINEGNAAVAELDRQYLQDLITQAERERQIRTDANERLRSARETNIQLDLKFLTKQQENLSLTVDQQMRIREMEFKLQKESIDNESKSNLERIANEREAVLNSGLTDDEWLETEESFHAEREAELRRHNGEIKMLTQQALEDKRRIALQQNTGFEAGLSGQDPFGGFLAQQQDSIIRTGKAALTMGDMVKLGMGIAGQAVHQMAEGVGSLVENWVLMGTTGPAALRKLTASILANLAKQATIEAIMELARGFANLAKAAAAAPTNPVAAAAYAAAADANFTAAAVFGTIAGVAAVSGRAIAGNAFAEQSATKSAADAKAKNDEIKHTDEGRRQFVEHIHRVVVTGEKGFVARQFVDEVKNNNQEVRRAVNIATK